MRKLRYISGNTWKYWIQSDEIHLKIMVTSIDEKMRESCLRLFCHVQKRANNAHLWKRVSWFNLREQKIGWGRPKNNISRNSKKDMSIKEITESMTLDVIEWRKRINVENLTNLLRIHIHSWPQKKKSETRTWLILYIFLVC